MWIGITEVPYQLTLEIGYVEGERHRASIAVDNPNWACFMLNCCIRYEEAVDIRLAVDDARVGTDNHWNRGHFLGSPLRQ